MERRVYRYETVGSTNTELMALARQGAAEGTVVLAGQQTAGRGRMGRSFQSPAGLGLYGSVLLRSSPEDAPRIPALAATAVRRAIRRSCGLSCGIKWPNDIVAHGKKVCGILTEMSAEPDYIHYVVIGCGINVNQMDFPEEIRATATSLALEKGERITRSALLLSIMEHFERAYDKFRETWDLTALLPAYHSYLLNKDARVRVLDPKGEFCGTARGINEAGELLVEKEDGELARVYAGEVSVRGVYGSV